jgi:hypothetical protein
VEQQLRLAYLTCVTRVSERVAVVTRWLRTGAKNAKFVGKIETRSVPNTVLTVIATVFEAVKQKGAIGPELFCSAYIS